MDLYPPQRVAIQKALKADRFILNWEMGCGKSAGAVEIINQLKPVSVLIVCPAIVRLDWLVAFQKFGLDQSVAAIRFGERKSLTKAQKLELVTALSASIQVTSPDLLNVVAFKGWDMIILDEIHMYKNEKASRSKEVREVLQANPTAMILGLTGTLAPDDIGDIWNPIDMLWPGRMGNKYRFRHRYQNKTAKIINDKTGETRTKFHGLRQEHAEELAYRLSRMSTRITRADVAEFLPAFDVKLLRFDTTVDWKLTSNTRSDIDYALEQAAKAKIGHVVEWAVAAKETTSHICVAAHHKNIAWAIAQKLSAECPLVPVVYVDGDMPVDKRIEAIESAKRAPNAILVCTIQSVGLGISLTKFTQAIVAEFHWSPGVIEQFLLRFSRLDSMIPSAVYFSMVPGTIDEVIATRLEEKFTAINPIAKVGVVGSKLERLLDLDEDTWIAELTASAMKLEEGGYLE